MTRTILFYSTRDEYGWMSNFYASPVVIGGKTWPTTEHANSPMVAARMGRARSRPLRGDWEQVKDAVMLEALRAKFSQHPDLKSRLLATGDALLVEHTTNDRYWADGGDGKGRNRLGELL